MGSAAKDKDLHAKAEASMSMYCIVVAPWLSLLVYSAAVSDASAARFPTFASPCEGATQSCRFAAVSSNGEFRDHSDACRVTLAKADLIWGTSLG
jgi:hypothetical protein